MPRNEDMKRRIADLVVLAQDFTADDGKPLLGDSKNLFLSANYPPECIAMLRGYGLYTLNINLVVTLLEEDLSSSSGVMRTTPSHSRWHTIMAKVLAKFADDIRVRRLALLPLRDGTWVSADSGLVYLPTTAEGIPVPLGLYGRVIHDMAAANGDRLTFFKRCGAVELPIKDVRGLIKGTTSRHFAIAPGLSESVSQLHFLFLSHLCEPIVKQDYYGIQLRTSRNLPTNATYADVYLSTDNPLGARELLKTSRDAPGLAVDFLHRQYLELTPKNADARCPSWKEWLCSFTGVRDRLRLVAPHGDKFSDAWKYTIDHRPEKALELLGHLWPFESSHITSSARLTALLKQTDATRLCSASLTKRCTLAETYLPLENLQKQCKRFMEHGEPFPFLATDPAMTSEQLRGKWYFLHDHLSVGIEDNVDFLCGILKSIVQANPKSTSISRPERLVDLYIAIDAKCAASANEEDFKRVV